MAMTDFATELEQKLNSEFSKVNERLDSVEALGSSYAKASEVTQQLATISAETQIAMTSLMAEYDALNAKVNALEEPPMTYELLTDKLAAAGALAMQRGANETVYIKPQTIDIPDTITIPPHVSLMSDDSIRPVILRYLGPSGTPEAPKAIVYQENSYGSTIRGFEIRGSATPQSNIVGFEIWQGINTTIKNVRISHKGKDCVGIKIKGRESVVISDVDIRASIGLDLRWGDNVYLHNVDIGAATSQADKTKMNDLLPSTCIQIAGKIDHLSTGGFVTLQGGDYAVKGRIDSPVFNSGMFFKHLRYEQSLTKQNPDIPAFELEFANKHSENIYLGEGVRIADRLNALKVTNALKLNISPATWIQGKREWNGKIWNKDTGTWDEPETPPEGSV